MMCIMFVMPRPVTSPPPLPPTPQQARGKARRRSLYDASVQAFAADGFDDARVEDIVDAAGVSWGTFWRYFPRKQDVLLLMGVEHWARVKAAADRATTDDGPVAPALRDLFAALLVSDWPSHLHGAMLREIALTPTRYSGMLGEDGTPWIQFIATMLARGQDRGEVRTDVDPGTLAAVMAAGVLFPAIQGGYEDLRSLRGLPGAGDPIAILDWVFPVAWRGVEAQPADPGLRRRQVPTPKVATRKPRKAREPTTT
jgi:AcrR family transcriptional regulator